MNRSATKGELYLSDVRDGKVVCGKWIKLVVERHYADLEQTSSADFPYYFDATRAARAVDLFQCQRLALGESSGKPFILMPWQAAIVTLLYGWRAKETHLRRFKKVYIKVARGNAKTEFLAGIGNMAFIFEGIKDAQVFWAATKREQAKIGYLRQRRMLELLIKDYPKLGSKIGFSHTRVFQKDGLGFVLPLGKDSKTEDGFSPYCALIDEYHAHPTADMVNVMESGMVKHRAPLLCIITTAGFNPESPCARFEEVCKRVLLGHAKAPFLLPFIYDLDEGDAWDDESVWIKANPSLGYTVTLEALRLECEKAKAEGEHKRVDFCRKNLNIWAKSFKSWIPPDVFAANGDAFNVDELEGAACFGALDLSRSRDLTALVLFFPSVNGGKHKILCRFWCPEKNAIDREKVDGTPYLEWARNGYIELTPGDVIDTDYIYKAIIETLNKYNVHSIAFDRFGALPLISKINKEFGYLPRTQTKCVLEPYAQTPPHFHTPMLEIEKMFYQNKVMHASNPVLKWMFQNVCLRTDANGNMAIDKHKSADKVDGVVALVMAVGQYITYSTDNFDGSKYSHSDVWALES